MTEEFKVEELCWINSGYVQLSINGEIYEYRFPAGSTYTVIKNKYGMNKGNFLRELKPYLIKD